MLGSAADPEKPSKPTLEPGICIISGSQVNIWSRSFAAPRFLKANGKGKLAHKYMDFNLKTCNGLWKKCYSYLKYFFLTTSRSVLISSSRHIISFSWIGQFVRDSIRHAKPVQVDNSKFSLFFFPNLLNLLFYDRNIGHQLHGYVRWPDMDLPFYTVTQN